MGKLDARVMKLEQTAGTHRKQADFRARLERSWAIKAETNGWSDRELAKHRKRHDDAVAAVWEKYGPLPPGSSFKAVLERAKAIQAELKQRSNHDEQGSRRQT